MTIPTEPYPCKCLNCNKDYDLSIQFALCHHGLRRDGLGADSLPPWPKNAAVNAESYFTEIELKMRAHPEVTDEDVRAMMAVIEQLFKNKRASHSALP